MTLIPYEHNFFIERKTGEESRLVLENAMGVREYRTGAVRIEAAPFRTDLKAWLTENAPCALIWCWYNRGGFTIALPDREGLAMRLRWCPPLDYQPHRQTDKFWDSETNQIVGNWPESEPAA